MTFLCILCVAAVNAWEGIDMANDTGGEAREQTVEEPLRDRADIDQVI
jgi:hypothetical protein